MENKTFNGDQKIKLTQIINEGMQVMHEIDTLQGGLTDTVKAVAEELEIKPAVLKKAIRMATRSRTAGNNSHHSGQDIINIALQRIAHVKGKQHGLPAINGDT
jgi:hypothetical protein